MPVEIRAPDGTMVRFPDGTPDATIQTVMAREYGGPQGEQRRRITDYYDDFARGAHQVGSGIFAGFGPEVAGGYEALGNLMVRPFTEPGTIPQRLQRAGQMAGEAYTRRRDEERDLIGGGHWAPRLINEIGGTAMTGGALESAIRSAGARVMAPGALAAPAVRAAPGVRAAPSGQESLRRGSMYAADASVGTAYGASIGDTPTERASNATVMAALSPVGTRAGIALDNLVTRGAERAASRDAARANYREADRLGVPLTRGQATGDISQRARENDMAIGLSTEGAQRQMAGFADRQADALREGIMSVPTRGQAAQTQSIGDAGVVVAEALRARRSALRGRRSDIYKEAFDAAGDVRIAPSDELLARADDVIEQEFLSVGPARNVLSDLQAQVAKGSATYQTVERARQQLNRLYGTALRAGDGAQEYAIMRMMGVLDDWTEGAVDNAKARALMGEARGINRELESFYGRQARPELSTGHTGTRDVGGAAIGRVLDTDLTGEQVVSALLGQSRPTQGTLAAVRRIRDIATETIKYTKRDAASGQRLPGRSRVGGRTQGARRFDPTPAEQARYGVELPSPELQALREAVGHRLIAPLTARDAGGLVPARTMVTQLESLLNGPYREIGDVLFTKAERGQFEDYLEVLRKMIPPVGVNTSGTAPALRRAVSQIAGSIGSMMFGGANMLTLGAAGALRGANRDLGASMAASRALSRPGIDLTPPVPMQASTVARAAPRLRAPMGSDQQDVTEMTGLPSAQRAGAALGEGDYGAAAREGAHALLALSPLAAGPRATAAVLGSGAALATGGVLLGSEAHADEPGLQAARSRVAELEANSRVFESVDETNPQSVIDAQRILRRAGQQISADGRLGPETIRAIALYREQVGRELAGARERLQSLEAQQAAESTRAGPLHEAARELGPWAATLGGAYLGHRSRVGAVRGANRSLAERNQAADALLTPGPVTRGRSAAARAEPAARSANINEFWRRGGAGDNVPFQPAQTARGFRPRPGAAPASSLYPPGASWFRPQDYGAIGAATGEAALSGGGLYLAQQELARAEAAVEREPSEANLERLERARDMVKLAESAMRAGLGFAAGRAGGAVQHRYPVTRPNVAGAESERMLLNQFLAPNRRPRR